MPSHYEQRLQRDLDWIRDLVGIVGKGIVEATEQAVSAVLTLNRDLAANVVVGDYTINRQTRELDRLCHAFVARHLPSAGHLRYVSSVLRLNIALERIGDYATTIARTAEQLHSLPPSVVVRDVEMMSEHARRWLNDALRSFHNKDLTLAQVTLTAATKFSRYFDRVFADLVVEGDAHSRPASELFGMMATFNRLERVIHQAKNICEETIFVTTGKVKSEKSVNLLFVDARNDGASQLAEHFTRKVFPLSGHYRSAGWAAADEVAAAYKQFAHSLGMDLDHSWPTPLLSLQDQLDEYHFVIALEAGARELVRPLPFHTTMLVWPLTDTHEPDATYRQIAPRVRQLMEMVRGEQAS